MLSPKKEEEWVEFDPKWIERANIIVIVNYSDVKFKFNKPAIRAVKKYLDRLAASEAQAAPEG